MEVKERATPLTRSLLFLVFEWLTVTLGYFEIQRKNSLWEGLFLKCICIHIREIEECSEWEPGNEFVIPFLLVSLPVNFSEIRWPTCRNIFSLVRGDFIFAIHKKKYKLIFILKVKFFPKYL